MKIRLGYVALSKAFDSSFQTETYTTYQKTNGDLKRLDNIIKNNLNTLYEILLYNVKNNIHFYRITSNLIPLATHKEVSFDYVTTYQSDYIKIANLINHSKMRCDMHPEQYAILNSTKKEVVENTKSILSYHVKLLKALQIEDPLLVLHVGSSVFGKEKSIERFIYQFNKLPKNVRNAIALENDDKTYTVEDVLRICEKLDIRMVLDYHHYLCNKGEVDIQNQYQRIFNTWHGKIPKVHFSSPKNKTKKDIRSHHDYIDINVFLNFIKDIENFTDNVDIMIEAKAKDDALFRLIRQLKYKSDYTFIDETSFYT